MMTSKGPATEFQISVPVPFNDDLEPVPNSPENQSFVVIKSAADLESLDDSEITDFSMALEHKNIIQQELAQLASFSNNPKPSYTTNFNQDIAKGLYGELNGSQREPISKPFANGINNELSSFDQSHSLSALQQPLVDNENTTISIADFSRSDFCSEGIQAKVYQLIEENTHLKDTLIQNNKSMKAQYDKVVAWQKDVERVYEANKRAFHERSKVIGALNEELAILKRENELLRHSLNAPINETQNNIKESELVGANENIEKLNKTLQGLTIQHKQEIDESDQKLKQMEDTLSELTKKNNNIMDVYDNKVRQLEEALQKKTVKANEDRACEAEKWTSMEMKLLRYESELESAYKKISSLEKQKNEAVEVKALEEQLLLSEMTKQRSQNENVFLKRHLERSSGLDAEMKKLQVHLDKVLNEKELLITDLDSKKFEILANEAKNQKLQEELEQTRLLVKENEAKVVYAKEKEEQAKVEAWISKRKVDELEQKCQQVQKAEVSKSDYNDELLFVRQQLMQSQKTLTDYNQKRAIAEAEATVLKSQIDEMKSHIGNKQVEDDMFALKAQLDVYRSDFDAEREAKEEVRRENNKIAEDLQQLHRRNQQLQEEIEHLREQLTQVGGLSHYPPRRSQPSDSSPVGVRYPCPICNIEFRSLKMIQDHLDTCVCHAPW